MTKGLTDRFDIGGTRWRGNPCRDRYKCGLRKLDAKKRKQGHDEVMGRWRWGAGSHEQMHVCDRRNSRSNGKLSRWLADE